MTPKTTRIAFIIFFCVIVALFLYMVSFMMKGAFLALIVAIVFYPIYCFFSKLFRQRHYLAAVITTFIVCGAILIPVVMALSVLAGNLVDFVNRLYTDLQSGQIAPIADRLEALLNYWLSLLPGMQDVTVDLRPHILNILKQAVKYLYQYSPNMFATTLRIVVTLVIVIIFLVIFLAEGSRFFSGFMRLMPLSRSHQEEISREIRVMVSATILGMVLVALMQGLFYTLGFWVLGFAEPFMWGVIAVLVSLVPLVGNAAINLVTFAVLLAMGRSEAAFIFLGYGVLLVSNIDNVLRPYIMGKRVHIHPVLLLMTLLGGVRVFGPLGILFGPVLLAIFLSMLRIYQREFLLPETAEAGESQSQRC